MNGFSLSSEARDSSAWKAMSASVISGMSETKKMKARMNTKTAIDR